MQPSEKWNYFESISLQNLLTAHDRLPLRHTAKNMVVDEVNNKTIAQFQVGFMSYTVFNTNCLSNI